MMFRIQFFALVEPYVPVEHRFGRKRHNPAPSSIFGTGISIALDVRAKRRQRD